MSTPIPVAPLLLDVETLCRWLEQPTHSADGGMLSDRFMKSHPAWVPHRAPLPHVNHLLDLLSRGQRQLNDELRSTRELAELDAVQKRQAILSLTRNIRRARKQNHRARRIIAHMKQDMGGELQKPLELYLRMFSLQSQQFKALSQSADSAVLALPRMPYTPAPIIVPETRVVSISVLKPFDFVMPAPPRLDPLTRVWDRCLTSFWSGSRVFRDWLMHPVIDSRTVPLLSRVPARSPLGDRTVPLLSKVPARSPRGDREPSELAG